MITLILAISASVDFGVILGYILSSAELLLVILHLVALFVDPDSKLGQILAKICIGLSTLVKYDTREDRKSEDEDDEDEG